MNSPETQPSLILRLKDLGDVQAWNDFAQIYEPLIYRLACKLGLQHADAMEAKQEVMLRLTHVVESWEPRPGGSFRGWLYRVARNVMLRYIEQRRNDPRGTGDTREQLRLAELASPELSVEFDLQWKKQVFAWASQKVRNDVEPQTWAAFWKTHVEGASVPEVAREMGVSRGRIYVARSRCIKRLREAVEHSIDPDLIPEVDLPDMEATP